MYIMWIGSDLSMSVCGIHAVANVMRVCVLQVGNLVMVDRNVVRKASECKYACFVVCHLFLCFVVLNGA